MPVPGSARRLAPGEDRAGAAPDVTDPETGGRCTVKHYQSEMQGGGEGWRHERITLMPVSSDPRLLPLVLVPKDEGAARVAMVGC